MNKMWYLLSFIFWGFLTGFINCGLVAWLLLLTVYAVILLLLGSGVVKNNIISKQPLVILLLPLLFPVIIAILAFFGWISK